jgi:hypothetical protein
MVLLVSISVFAGDAMAVRGRFQGQIIAYRPAEMVIEFASHVLNKKTFLFRASDPEIGIVKLVYEHFGYAIIDSDTLMDLPIVTASVTRDEGCDETLG